MSEISEWRGMSVARGERGDSPDSRSTASSIQKTQWKSSGTMWKCIPVLAVICLSVLEVGSSGCEKRQGCRIQQGVCLCGVGCPSDYIYLNKEECKAALKGRGGDVCQHSPCLNNGSCSQTTAPPGFKCRCEGTGYTGPRCQYACPKPGQVNNPPPFECIVI